MDQQTRTLPESTRRTHRWTTAEHRRLVADGDFPMGARAFLWDGDIIEPMSEDPPHVNAVDNLCEVLQGRIRPPAWLIRVGHPLELADGFMPQPDLVVVRGPRSRYKLRAATPADAALVAEAAVSSHHPKDSVEYLRRYALDGVAQYWVIDVKGRKIDVHLEPDAESGQFGTRREYGLNDSIRLNLGAIEGEAGGISMDVAVAEVLRDSLKED